jgi:hypothetical protein
VGLTGRRNPLSTVPPSVQQETALAAAQKSCEFSPGTFSGGCARRPAGDADPAGNCDEVACSDDLGQDGQQVAMLPRRPNLSPVQGLGHFVRGEQNLVGPAGALIVLPLMSRVSALVRAP